MATAEQYAEWIVANAGKKGTPEFETVAQAYKLARSETPALGSIADTPGQIPNQVIAPTPSAPAGNRFVGAGEAGLSLLTGVAGGLAGQVAGIGRALTGGSFGTPEGIRQGQSTATDVSRSMTYRPRTESGQEQLSGLAGMLESTKLAGLGPAEGIALAGVAGPAATQARGLASRVVPVQAERSMVGMGSAMTDPARIRAERAAALPVPLDLTKGQLSRTFEQQQFEREIAKQPVGAPLRERFAQQNENILRNFDEWVDQTGAQAPDLRATGQVVNLAISEKANKAKGAITAAYERARASGEMNEPVPAQPLLDYVASKQPEAINAPVISSLGAKLESLVGPDKTISVNGMEEVRKMVGNLSGKDATNAHFGKEIKQLIDTLTEGKGGEDYKRARALRTRYANEFENVGVVDKLMSVKPGTKDRAVAYEDVFNHSILSGSLDDVRVIRKTLQTAGTNGEQAWKELQGQTVNYLKDAASKNAQRDIRGNPVVSFSGLDKAIRNLDQDGKLDFIFGKQGAQQLRDVRDLSADVFTSPQGSVNTSNTNSAFWQVVNSLPGAKTIGVAKDLLSTRKERQQVQQALNPGPLTSFLGSNP